MAAKGSPKKSLKSFFSRSDASTSAPAEKNVDKSEGEKKKFKLLNFKVKSKKPPASEKPAAEKQEVLSAVESSNAADDREERSKRSSLYGTAPRSKNKEFSYSEMDLRKPKKFASFSLGLRKRKKTDEDNIFKSAVIFQSSDIEGRKKTLLDPNQMELDQANKQKMFSMSQPELDTSNTIDIPSPVATTESESYFNLINEPQSSVAVNGQLKAKEPVTNSSNLFDVHKEPQKAPIATIPELQLDYSASSEETKIAPVHDNTPKSNPNSPVLMTHPETTSIVDHQTAPILPDSQLPVMLDTSDHKAEVVDSVCTSNGPCDSDNLQQPSTTTGSSLADSTKDLLSHHQPDAPDAPDDDMADGTTPNDTPSLASVDSKTDGATTTAASAVSGENSTRPVIEPAVYGALYDSLFPENFTSEVTSALLNPPPPIRTKTRSPTAKLEPVMVKTLNECHTETSVTCPRLSREFDSAAGRVDDAAGAFNNINEALGERELISSSESATFTPDQTSKPTDSNNIHYSELTHSVSEVKSDSSSLSQDTVRSVPVVQNSAPPVSDCS
ncbi:uncharacterized protein LOC143335290 [Chaetodon auriga]|uniref:uncharacterized protein LOC143335290 n=1 Tax=Chaetodon auriga TaxID=39042 RepID=UPI004032897B